MHFSYTTLASVLSQRIKTVLPSLMRQETDPDHQAKQKQAIL